MYSRNSRQAANKSNGRINAYNIPTSDVSTLLKMQEKIPVHQCTTFQSPLIGVWDETELSRTFFDKSNIQQLQNGIRYGVYLKSKNEYIIPEQDCDVLKMIMRGVFLENSTNTNVEIDKQIRDLNAKVLEYSIPTTFSETQAYIKYLSDVSTLVTPLAHPVDTSVHTNNKAHKMHDFF